MTIGVLLAVLFVAASASARAERSERFVAGGWQVIVRRTVPGREAPATTGSLPHGTPAIVGAQSGLASYYWQGTQTASGEPFDRSAMTAAHKTLPFGTQVRVTHLVTGRSVLVRINDRGPFKPGRIIDLSEGAAQALGITQQGLARVRVDVVGRRADAAGR